LISAERGGRTSRGKKGCDVRSSKKREKGSFKKVTMPGLWGRRTGGVLKPVTLGGGAVERKSKRNSANDRRTGKIETASMGERKKKPISKGGGGVLRKERETSPVSSIERGEKHSTRGGSL